MNNELNTLLTTIYVFPTDRVLPDLGHNRDRRLGRKVQLDDAELLCLVVAQHLLHGSSSEARSIRYAGAHLRGHFPQIPHQSGYNKRVRAAGPLISAAITALARPGHRVLARDSASSPIHSAALRHVARNGQTLRFVRPRGHGYCASRSRFFWGFRLYLVSAPERHARDLGTGEPQTRGTRSHPGTARTRAPAGHAGQVILGDEGFAGRDFERFVTEDLGATLIRPDRKDENPRFGRFGGIVNG